MGGWVLKMSSFAVVQYCIYADLTPLVGGSEKIQNYADVIYGWSLGCGLSVSLLDPAVRL